MMLDDDERRLVDELLDRVMDGRPLDERDAVVIGLAGVRSAFGSSAWRIAMQSALAASCRPFEPLRVEIAEYVADVAARTIARPS